MKRLAMMAVLLVPCIGALAAGDLEGDFTAPPESARPWVYWMFMDGQMTREGMTADLEAMKRAGIGGAIILEVNIGIPRGTVVFMSQQWRLLIKHAIDEADRLGLQIALGAGPGWCGTGGPWVKPEQSMQHLVASETTATGPSRFDAVLARPAPRVPFFGEKTLTPELHKLWKEFYRDAAVLAYPTPAGDYRIPDIDEKALYFRAPYSSKPGVKPFLTADKTVLPADRCIDPNQVIELSGKLSPDGRLIWDVPKGNWTILRFGRTLTGQTTRPAPLPGLGLESDKFDKAALDAHFDGFIGALLKTVGEPPHPGRGLTMVHFDSWEMSSQNWSENFRREFHKRRGYDPLRFLPVMLGHAEQSVDVSERFLWDLRLTAQELVVENHALHLKELGRRHGLTMSIEPYDLNPAGDLELGGAADVPMCEFWSRGYGFNTDFSSFEAVSVAHTMGRGVIGAEAFTSTGDGWRQHPGSMKAQGDWALCAGINRFVFHRFQHQPWLDRFPGMTFGPYGVYWDRTETWWNMAQAYHTYLARCQAVLRRGLPVADILYLDRQGAPNVFLPPKSATLSGLPDRRGYNFDGCAPGALMERAAVKDGRIVLPDGMSYRLLVLPRSETMSPRLLEKVKELVEAGASVMGSPPKRSPSLEDYPQCDAKVQFLARETWKGNRVIGDEAAGSTDTYPNYDAAAGILAAMNVPPDFESDGDLRYIHRRDKETDIYFVGNRTAGAVSANCRFRVAGRQPELWDPVTGEMNSLPEYEQKDGRTVVPLRFDGNQSFFAMFRKKAPPESGARRVTGKNHVDTKPVQEMTGPWAVQFDPKWSGLANPVTFSQLEDWTRRAEEGIKYYSGTATYRKGFDLAARPADEQQAPQAEGANSTARGVKRMWLDLGDVHVMASVRLNDCDLGVVWCRPWRVAIPAGLLKDRGNRLEITVANLWCNRLIGDSALPADKRLTWTTHNPFKPGSTLQPSGLLGPVKLTEQSR